MKISEVKFFNSVKVGNQELIVASHLEGLNNKPAYEIEINDNLVKIKELGTGECTYTGLYNTVWFRELKDADKIRPPDIKNDVVKAEDKNRGRQVSKAK